MSNPTLTPEIFERETNRGGGFVPAWGSPADELPSDLFDQQRGGSDAPRGSAGGPVGPVSGSAMSLNGVLSASAVLMLLVLVAGAFAWNAMTVEAARNLDGDLVIVSPFPGWVLRRCSAPWALPSSRRSSPTWLASPVPCTRC